MNPTDAPATTFAPVDPPATTFVPPTRPWSALYKQAKTEAYELSATQRTAVTMALKTVLSFVHTATQTTCTLLVGLLGTLTDVEAYVRPLCRRCIEQQYWLLRLVRSETVKAIGDTLKASAKDTAGVVEQGTQPLVSTVQEIYEEELVAFARGRVGGGEGGVTVHKVE